MDRLSQQIEHLRERGELHNPTTYHYARENASALNMDMRIFNGTTPRRSDITEYRGVGRPRASDYTAGGNLRKAK